jgi:enamine deaminase RidA (YjgF/YER057c/UK114 family)
MSGQTTQTLDNIEYIINYTYTTILAQTNPTFIPADRIVKCVVYILSTKPEAFVEMNDAYRKFFSSRGVSVPARMSFSGATLALGAEVEIDCTAVF